MKQLGISSLLCLVLLFSVSTGCGPSQEEYDEQVSIVTELRSELAEASRRQNEMQGQIEQLNSENGDLSERLEVMGQLASDLEEARRVAAEYQRRARQQRERLAAFRNMMEQFRAMIDSGRLRVRIVRGRMVIEMPSNILFTTGSADLSDQGEETLSEVAAVLRTISNRHFQVAGHTDNVPIRTRRFPSNWELSAQRAVNVVHYLQEQNVNPTFLSAAGHAEYAPSASNDNDEGRQQNRRIEVVLLPNLDELPDMSSLAAEVDEED